ncbi:hypothetical protein INT46_002596 [Mucor plumbeus]|uniref:Uncharacterized protein n=1 Tax=Mucor plumbeus TaxID=97098 RepID=A0A8H7QDL3_9FUNG|nr:hypothetical protein INT46_002596 [Mucor plumbeus]
MPICTCTAFKAKNLRSYSTFQNVNQSTDDAITVIDVDDDAKEYCINQVDTDDAEYNEINDRIYEEADNDSQKRFYDNSVFPVEPVVHFALFMLTVLLHSASSCTDQGLNITMLFFN